MARCHLYWSTRLGDPFLTSTQCNIQLQDSTSTIATTSTLCANMRSLWFIAALSLFQLGSAADQKKSAIIWFDNPATPAAFMDQVKDSILKAGGRITHTYTIIKYVSMVRRVQIRYWLYHRGFAVIAPANALASVQSLGAEHSIRVEEDETVSSLWVIMAILLVNYTTFNSDG